MGDKGELSFSLEMIETRVEDNVIHLLLLHYDNYQIKG